MDDMKLSLARAIHGTDLARKESFSPEMWKGVERAWAWITLSFQPSNPDTYLNEFLREKLRTETSVHDAIREAVQQQKEPTVKQEPTIYGAPIIEDKYMPSGYGLVGVNMSAFEKPAPSPAPAGVAPWPTVQECKSEFAKGSGGIYPAFNTPGEYGIKAMHALFERGRRTRDERIAELERERDELLAKMGTHLEHHIQGADAMQNLLDEKRATIATLTKERDEAREELDRASKTAFDAVGSFGGAVCDKINALNSRDAALARVAELTKERDIIKSIAAQAQDRVAELEQVTRDDCGLKTELGMTRASLDTARLAADTFLSECRRHKADNRELKRKIAQLEARESERMKVSVDATVAELEKRVAVDVDACAREIAERIQVDTLNDGDACWGSGVWAEIIRKHTRDVRRITREEARVVYQLLPHTTWDDTIAALRAIGFEVEQ